LVWNYLIGRRSRIWLVNFQEEEKKMNAKSILGCVFVLVSGVLFTMERFLAVLKWSVLTTPILTRGSGTYSESTVMPGLTTNFFVVLFLVIGVILVVLRIYDVYK
jgi:hypothetical protein